MKYIISNIILIQIILIGVSCHKFKKEDSVHRTISTKFHQKINTPIEALVELKYGNNRFVDNMMKNTNYKEQIAATKDGQHPHTFILSCIDSRVPPEIIFDQGIGNLFVARVAGNIENDHILGSMEFATKVKHSKLIVVLGHYDCGAIKGAIENVGLEHLTELTNNIKPAINKHKSYPIPEIEMEHTMRNNVTLTIQRILKKSATIRLMIQANELKIIGAYYDIRTGEVEFLN